MYPSAPTWAPEKLAVPHIPPMVIVLPSNPRTVAAPAWPVVRPIAVAERSTESRMPAPTRILRLIWSPFIASPLMVSTPRNVFSFCQYGHSAFGAGNVAMSVYEILHPVYERRGTSPTVTPGARVADCAGANRDAPKPLSPSPPIPSTQSPVQQPTPPASGRNGDSSNQDRRGLVGTPEIAVLVSEERLPDARMPVSRAVLPPTAVSGTRPGCPPGSPSWSRGRAGVPRCPPRGRCRTA